MADSTPPLQDFDKLWDYHYRKPDETEARFRELLPMAEQSGNTAYHLELLTQIARTQGLQGKFDEAHRTLDTVQDRLTDDSSRPRIRYLLERGRAFNSSNHKDQARPLFLEAWERAAAAGEEFYAIDAAHMMGIVEPPEEQLAWNLKALEMAERASDPRASDWRGSLYNNIGWSYHDRGDHEKALELFEKALRFRLEQGDEHTILIARWCVARTLRSLNRIDEALSAQQSLLEERLRRGDSGGYVSEEIGECLLALGRQEEARPHFARAYEELSKDLWLTRDQPERLARLKQLGGLS